MRGQALRAKLGLEALIALVGADAKAARTRAQRLVQRTL
jgi:hypothetical protein